MDFYKIFDFEKHTELILLLMWDILNNNNILNVQMSLDYAQHTNQEILVIQFNFKKMFDYLD